jgi:hypothetical protein
VFAPPAAALLDPIKENSATQMCGPVCCPGVESQGWPVGSELPPAPFAPACDQIPLSRGSELTLQVDESR